MPTILIPNFQIENKIINNKKIYNNKLIINNNNNGKYQNNIKCE